MKKANLFAAPFLIALTLVLGACGKDEKDASRNPVQQPVITNIADITGAADRRTLVGRKVEATDVLVTRVVGNYIFWGGTGNDVPILLENEMRGTANEKDVQIKRGQRLRIVGVVRLIDAPAADPKDPMWSMINKKEKEEIVAARVYISATEVKTMSGARTFILP